MVQRTEKRPGCQGLNAPQHNVVPTSPDVYSLTYLYILMTLQGTDVSY